MLQRARSASTHDAPEGGNNICERILEKAILHLPADVEESPEDWMPWNYTHALAELDAIAATPA